ncbi:MAG: TerB family tellurite resistance protein [Candidatus Abyssobacteria bacterium SURF_5]|uniref:TerB family tellurite resistance protein n=1 Tax=Abyssobacteria bacterium (strain SURF_5) TaxID=2093360 RepID=A0A3A4P5C6_ABYX5|nr:MAG: TerB family tellurite resistance protein [Candidatus Abyssubacteria bacterium SURF_5]
MEDKMVIQKLKDLFSNQRSQVQRAAQEDTETRVRLATCVLLLAVAHSDDRFNEAEEDRIVEVLKEDFRLSEEYVSELIELAHQERKESVDLFRFTKVINSAYNPEEKLQVVQTLWKVVYADDRLHSLEDNLIHRLSRMLNLSHHQLIEAKKKVMGWE